MIKIPVTGELHRALFAVSASRHGSFAISFKDIEPIKHKWVGTLCVNKQPVEDIVLSRREQFDTVGFNLGVEIFKWIKGGILIGEYIEVEYE